MTPKPFESMGSHSGGRSGDVDYSRQDSVKTSLTSQLLCEHDDHCMSPNDWKTLRHLDGNDYCIDCGVGDPEWASINLAIFVCLECSGQHRAMGTHISKVRSVKMDSWSESQVALMKSGGNKQCVVFLKKHGLRRHHSIAERYDCAAAMLYQSILQAWRDGTEEPTTVPDYTPTRHRTSQIPKESFRGIGSQHNHAGGGSSSRFGFNLGTSSHHHGSLSFGFRKSSSPVNDPFSPGGGLSPPGSPLLRSLKKIGQDNAKKLKESVKLLEEKGKEVESSIVKSNEVLDKAVGMFLRLACKVQARRVVTLENSDELISAETEKVETSVLDEEEEADDSLVNEFADDTSETGESPESS